MSSGKKFVWAQNSIDDLVSNTGWSPLTDVNSITYKTDMYKVNDLIGIKDTTDRLNVAMLLLGCSHTSALRIVVFGVENIIHSCLDMRTDYIKFKRCFYDCLQSLSELSTLSDEMKAVFRRVDEEKDNSSDDDGDNVSGDDNDKDKTEDEDYKVTPDYLESILLALKKAASDLENIIEINKCNLREPKYNSLLATWKHCFNEKANDYNNLFHKYLMGEVDKIIRSAFSIKYSNSNFKITP